MLQIYKKKICWINYNILDLLDSFNFVYLRSGGGQGDLSVFLYSKICQY